MKKSHCKGNSDYPKQIRDYIYCAVIYIKCMHKNINAVKVYTEYQVIYYFFFFLQNFKILYQQNIQLVQLESALAKIHFMKFGFHSYFRQFCSLA